MQKKEEGGGWGRKKGDNIFDIRRDSSRDSYSSVNSNIETSSPNSAKSPPAVSEHLKDGITCTKHFSKGEFVDVTNLRRAGGGHSA
jgi:hypothetical protein